LSDDAFTAAKELLDALAKVPDVVEAPISTLADAVDAGNTLLDAGADLLNAGDEVLDPCA